MTTSTSPAIELHDLNFRYAQHQLLKEVSLTVETGEFLALVGPNGCGKSTLLKLILGLIKPLSGDIRVLGQTPDKARCHVGYVPQFASFNRDFPITVEETVLQGRLGCHRRLGSYNRADRMIAEQALQEVEATHLSQQVVQDLSGGQLQRVMLARALASEPQILMLDEPTANIDSRGETDIFDLLRNINERSMTIIVVSHDIAFISAYVSRVACLNQTLICHHTDALTGDVIQDLYCHATHAIHHHHH